ncbi:putative NADH-flavin reductase [Actinocorallia herbida]|uniref:Putative NADH-flavin reductase n=1 Tax=Actinocorallia herbida TaxID=58109 RepID=A0A3N1DAE1_9ACTN|nr:NAD(P)-binding oxidoreductase [Actinocorallia herbida]ROO90469.1 putative NADH-flavin reductase [Actinocorallia herbida]
MDLTMFGATGRTGRHLVRAALAAGHRVTAVVRDPARLETAAHPLLEVVTADPLDPAAIEDAVAGRDAVLSALGASDRTSAAVCGPAARSIIAAMRAGGTRRLVFVTASGHVVDAGDGLATRRIVKPLVGRFLAGPFADFADAEREIRASGLDWTIVRPPRLTDGPAKPYRTAVDRNVRGGLSLSRTDLARAVLAAAADPATAGHTVAAGY